MQPVCQDGGSARKLRSGWAEPPERSPIVPKRFAARRAPAAAKPLPSLGEAARVRIPVSDDDVRREAYQRWEAAGRPPGDGVEYWLVAERKLRGV